VPPAMRVVALDGSLKLAAKQRLVEDFHHHEIVRRIKANDFRWTAGDLTLHLAREMGFCYGVERSVRYAYETLEQFSGARIFITDEIIHNPQVNERLISLGMRFLHGRYACGLNADELGGDDVVLIPAFGVTVPEMETLRERGCILVDTTCGSVLNVWKRVERFAREGFTAVVHGQHNHAETRATVSQVSKYPDGCFLVVHDLPETRVVADYIRDPGRREAFLARFAGRTSSHFDPDQHLGRIGLANQTTMMCSESLAVQRLLHEAMLDRYGKAETARRFAAFDTICSATQDRQGSLEQLLHAVALDMVLVVGGFNSSNTSHLTELGAAHAPTYHVQDGSGLVSEDEIRHRDPVSSVVHTVHGWLAKGPLAVGITAGASTPDGIVGGVIERLFQLRGISLDSAALRPESSPS
jgi:4-hydroxy-3-methylbut-2-enyl diphosphate reductase